MGGDGEGTRRGCDGREERKGRRRKGGEKRGRDVGVWTEREKNGREMDGGGVGWRRKEGEEGMKESYSTIVGGGQGKVEL